MLLTATLKKTKFKPRGKTMSDTLLIEKVYERFSAGDLDGWAQLHTPDFEFKYLGNLPFSGIFKGQIGRAHV